MATRTFTINVTDSNKNPVKRWAKSPQLDGIEVSVPAPDSFTEVPAQLAGCFENVEALNHFLHTGVTNALWNEVAGIVKGDTGISRDALIAAAEAVRITPPARRSGESKANALTAEKRRREQAEAEAEAKHGAIVELLRALPAKDRASKLDAFKASGILPADFDISN
jgi:hypothetical protein